MPINDPLVQEQAFREETDVLRTVKLQSQENGVKYLRSILNDAAGMRFLYGPASSGKSTIIRKFVSELHRDIVFAAIDGSGLTPQELLAQVMSQFGYQLTLESVDDLLRMIKVFAIQQMRVCQPPLVVVENIENMQPGTLRILCLLASLTFQSQFAIRIVLTGSSRASYLLKSEGMLPVSKRTVAVFEVEPFSPRETTLYLHGRLRYCGMRQVEQVFPMSECDKLHRLSGGLPGLLNEHAKELLKREASLPVREGNVQMRQDPEKIRPAAPQLIVTWNGETVEQYAFREKKVIIGRSILADIVIHNQYASKFHALMLLYADALVLVDLNSANGTFVNSFRASSAVLQSGDTVSLASHRIKVVDAPEADPDKLSTAMVADTKTMKTLEDRRKERQARFPFFDINRKAVH